MNARVIFALVAIVACASAARFDDLEPIVSIHGRRSVSSTEAPTEASNYVSDAPMLEYNLTDENGTICAEFSASKMSFTIPTGENETETITICPAGTEDMMNCSVYAEAEDVLSTCGEVDKKNAVLHLMWKYNETNPKYFTRFTFDKKAPHALMEIQFIYQKGLKVERFTANSEDNVAWNAFFSVSDDAGVACNQVMVEGMTPQNATADFEFDNLAIQGFAKNSSGYDTCPADATTASPTQEPSSSSSNKGVIIGVSVVLAIIVVVCAAILIRRQIRKNRLGDYEELGSSTA